MTAYDENVAIKIVQEKLGSKIRVSVEWDGYYDIEKMEDHFDTAIASETSFSFNQVKDITPTVA